VHHHHHHHHHHLHHIYFRLPEGPQKPIELATIKKQHKESVQRLSQNYQI